MNEQLKAVRGAQRVTANQLIKAWTTDFFRLHGDRVVGDDPALTAGFGRFGQQTVLFLGINRGQSLPERRAFNGGALTPSGYRLASRAVKLAMQFGWPVVSLLNLPGADASPTAERYNQSQAIADLILQMGELTVPNVAVFLGEGHSGGALAFANANRLLMLDDALFNVASPEAVQAILRQRFSITEILSQLPMTAPKLATKGLVDQVIDHQLPNLAKVLGQAVTESLQDLAELSATELVSQRQEKFAQFND